MIDVFLVCKCRQMIKDFDAHVAAVLVEALGLTQEWAAGQIIPGESDYTITSGSRGSSRENAEKCLYFPRFDLISRWTTGWEPTNG